MEKEKLLFIDACISNHSSRTKKLSVTYIEEFMKKHPEVDLETVVLRKGRVEPLTKEYIDERNGYVSSKDWQQPMFDFARQFQDADYIVIGAPYWDLSFPSILKVYFENIVVADLTFEATEAGFKGLCKGKKLVYITTAGGFIGDKNLGYDYMCGLAEMLGVKACECIKAEALDIVGFDAEEIVNKAIEAIKNKFK